MPPDKRWAYISQRCRKLCYLFFPDGGTGTYKSNGDDWSRVMSFPPKKTFGSLIEETGQCKPLQMKKTIGSSMLAIWFQMVDFHYLTPLYKKDLLFFLV